MLLLQRLLLIALTYTLLQALTKPPLKIIPQNDVQMQSHILSLSLYHFLSRPADWYRFWKWNSKDIFN